MNPLIPKLESEIQAADAAGRRLLTEALASGSHESRAYQCHRAAMAFTEAATLSRLRLEMLAADTTNDKAPPVYTIGGGSGTLHVVRVKDGYRVLNFRRDEDGSIDWRESTAELMANFPDQVQAAEYVQKLKAFNNARFA